jgi:hypothetical protein
MLRVIRYRVHNGAEQWRWLPMVIGGVCCLAGFLQVEVTAESSFFATESPSRASLVKRAENLYVTKGPTPPSDAGKRGTRVLPPNLEPGKRKVSTRPFPGIPDFRSFGIKQPGALKAPGARRIPNQ